MATNPEIAHHKKQIQHAMSRIRVNIALDNFEAIEAWARDAADHARAAARIVIAAAGRGEGK